MCWTAITHLGNEPGTQEMGKQLGCGNQVGDRVFKVTLPSRCGCHYSARTRMLARNYSPTAPMDDCRSADLRWYSLGATPISRLKTRLKELSDPYPTTEATSENDVL